jgi:anti-sigma regulatory factor (Ser/Thr protein kinase)
MAWADSVCDPTAPAQLANPAASAARWPDQSILELGALPSAVPCVRLHTTLVLREWRMTALADAAELVTAELATNAVQAASSAAPAPAGLAVIRLHLASDRRQVLVEVGDDDLRPPTPAGPNPERDGGRGLLLVESVSARWGCYYLNPAAPATWRGPGQALIQPGAKVVWALITPDSAAADDLRQHQSARHQGRWG